MPKETLSDATLRAIREEVAEAVSSRVKDYKKLAYAFLLGLGLLVVSLVANRLLSKRSALVFLHDTVFGAFGANLDSALAKDVNFSYADQFFICDKAPSHFTPFYADAPQDVEALIQVHHYTPLNPETVTVQLDNETTVFSDAKEHDLLAPPYDLRQRISAVTKVHHLQISIPDRATPKNLASCEKAADAISVSVIVNVLGLEDRPE